MDSIKKLPSWIGFLSLKFVLGIWNPNIESELNLKFEAPISIPNLEIKFEMLDHIKTACKFEQGGGIGVNLLFVFE